MGRSAAIAWRQDRLIHSVSADPALTTAQLIAIADNTTGDSGRENRSLSRRPVGHDSQGWLLGMGTSDYA
jgi:hypothetical protein